MLMFRLALLLAAMLASGPALAARCGGDFNTFVRNISAEAASAGISQDVIATALDGVTQDKAVLAFDRRQRGTFRKTFEEYVATRVTAGRISGARAMLKRHAALLTRVEQRFGVPREIIVAIWGLESDVGKGDTG
jgi:membrane-bound lytic murein transglycosylase B